MSLAFKSIEVEHNAQSTIINKGQACSCLLAADIQINKCSV